MDNVFPLSSKCLLNHGTGCASHYTGVSRCILADDVTTNGISPSKLDSLSETGHGPLQRQEEFFVSWTCPEMLAIQRLVPEIARTDFPVLIEGESGTGKEVFATQIHELSRDSELPFV